MAETTRQLEHVFRIYVYPGLVWTGRNLPKSSPTQSDEREISRELNYVNKSNNRQGNISIVEEGTHSFRAASLNFLLSLPWDSYKISLGAIYQ